MPLQCLAFNSAPIPLGIVLRKSLFSKTLNELNRRNKNQTSQNENPMSLDLCIAGVGSHMTVEGIWSDEQWHQIDDHTVYLSSKVKEGKLSFEIFESCEKDSKRYLKGNLAIQAGRIIGVWNISDLSIQLSVDANSSQIIPTLDEYHGLDSLLKLNPNKESLIKKFTEIASNQVTAWIKTKFNNFVLTQSAADLIGDVPILQSGTLFERGAIKLQLADPQPSQKLIKFSIYSRKTESAFALDDALEFYLNTSFLDLNRQTELTGLNPLFESPEKMSLGINRSLAALGAESDVPIIRPSLSQSSGDLSLILPEALVNSTLALFYKEGLLRFRTTIGLGAQTKGVITKDEQDVATVLTIKPDAAPSVNFLADQFKLEVKDYVMDVGTYIEDRIIPQSQITSHITLSAHLEVDTKKEKIKLLLNPEDLLLDLNDLKNRLGAEEINFFKGVANGVWKDFLRKNSDLYLLPLVFRPEGLNVAVRQTKLDGKNIVLDLDLELRE